MKKVLSTISVILFLLAGCVTASAETIPGVSVHTADGNPALKSETGEKPIEKSAEAERDKIKFEGEDKSGIEQDELPKIYTYINGVENMYQIGFYRKNISQAAPGGEDELPPRRHGRRGVVRGHEEGPQHQAADQDLVERSSSAPKRQRQHRYCPTR